MKKHEAITQAYKNYPKGTKFKNISTGDEVTSSGLFLVAVGHQADSNVREESWWVYDSGNCNLVYRNSSKKWAEIIKDEPLKVEKIAVRVKNESELKSIGEKHNLVYGVRCYSGYGYPKLVRIKDDKATSYTLHGPVEKDAIHDGYTIIDFDFWAAQDNVDVPKFVMKSEDGVDLYMGYPCVSIFNGDQGWYFSQTKGICGPSWEKDTRHKIFSTIAAAEKWMEEQKPKEITLDLDDLIVQVFKKGFTAEAKSDTRRFAFDHLDLEKIYEAFKSL